MKRIAALIIALLMVLALSITASASFSFKDLNIKLPDELKKIIDETKTDELAEKVRGKLDEVKNMSDEEIYQLTKDFCEKYRIELNDDQIKKASEYVKKATNFSLQDIKDEIESVKTKVSAFARFLGYLKSSGEKIISYLSSAASAIQEFIKNIFFSYNGVYLQKV